MNLRARQKIEAFFSHLAITIYDHSIKSIFLTVAFIAALMAAIPLIVIDTSAVALLRQDDPARLRFDQFREQFDENDLIVIAVTPPEVYSLAFLKRLQDFHRDLEAKVPYIKRVTSLINARESRGEGDALKVGELLDTWPQTLEDLEKLRERVEANPLYSDSLISRDGRVTTIVLETEAIIASQTTAAEEDLVGGFDDENTEAISPGPGAEADHAASPRYFSEKENQQVVASINRLVAKYEGEHFAIALAGDPIVLDVYNRAMQRDIVLVVLLSLIVIAVFLTILFRRVSGVILPEIIVNGALFSTMGLLALFKVSIKLTTVVLPGFLLTVSVGGAVHILAIFYRRYQAGHNKRDAIAYAMGHSGFAVVLTALTTAASLFSFAFAELTAIADLGFFGATGVLLALVYTIILLPAGIALMPIKRKIGRGETTRSAAMDRILMATATISTRHPRKILVGTAIVFIAATVFATQVTYSHNVLNWISTDEKVRSDVPLIDDQLRGSIILEVLLDTRQEGGVKSPLVLSRLERLSEELGYYTNEHLYVGKVFSLNDIVKETHRSLHDNDHTFFTIPEDGDIIAQELLLFENSGSDDLERVVDSQYRTTRISIKTPWSDAVHLRDLITIVEERFKAAFPPPFGVTVTGIPTLLARSIPAALNSMAKSYVAAFVVITLMMIVHVGSVKIGLISMISNLLPILMTMGLMGALKIRLDMSTIMIGSIAIGIVVDDTLHFMYNFRKFHEEGFDVHGAIRETMLGTGRALLLTTLILSSGFFILMVASLSLLVVFGFLTGITILFALLADFIINPALMVLVTRQTATPLQHPLASQKTDP